VDRNTPEPKVPANRVVPLAVRERMSKFVGCVVAAVQVRPPSVERNTPEPQVPANRVVPLAVRASVEGAVAALGLVAVLLLPQPMDPVMQSGIRIDASRMSYRSFRLGIGTDRPRVGV
jgi:hypothetical protein